jgi:hypothetical protein
VDVQVGETMRAYNENRKSYEVKIFPFIINDEHFYKVIICDVDWINNEKDSYNLSVRDIFVFPNLRAAVEAMTNFYAEGHYPEE